MRKRLMTTVWVMTAVLLGVCSIAVASKDYKFVWKVPNSGWSFDSPSGVAVDAGGNVYVADTWNDRIQKFSSAGVFLAKWGSSGSGDGQFSFPSGIAVDAGGNVYVTDTDNSRIQKFTSDGVFLAKWGSSGSGDGQFWNPFGVAVDAGGRVYVADSGNSRIQKFTSAGAFLAKWGSYGSGDGQFWNPFGVAVDAGGRVYVADTRNNRIQKFTSAGIFLAKWGSSGTGNGQFYYPRGVAVDAGGNVYVADSGNNRIQKFTSASAFLTKWGSVGTGDGQFNDPEGVAVDARDNVYVADTYNNRIQKFQPVTGHEAWQTAYRLCLPEKESLDILRRYRDQVLRSSDLGRRFVTILYRKSDEALSVLLGNPQLLMSARELMSQDIDAVVQVLEGGDGMITNTDAVATFFTEFSQKASPDLGTILIEVRNGILKAKEEKKPFLGFRLN